MRRQYVHLSIDRDTRARWAGASRATPVILRIDAKRRRTAVAFYAGNEKVWLADRVRPNTSN